MTDDTRDDDTGFGGDADIPALGHDDDLLSALGTGATPEGLSGSEARLAALLAGWREDAARAPLPAGPSADDIAAAYAPNVVPLGRARAARRARDRRRHSLGRTLAGAAAVVTVVVGGVSVASYSSHPGDPLWGVSKTLFSDRAGSIELVSSLDQDLDAAGAAWQRGDRDEARRLLDQVSARIDSVPDATQRVDLMRRRDEIERNLSRVAPSPVTSPAAPVPTAPEAAEPAPTVTPTPAAPSSAPAAGSSSAAPSTAPSDAAPVIPIPLDLLQLSTTLDVPIDPNALASLLNRPVPTPTPSVVRPPGQIVVPLVPTPPALPSFGLANQPTPTTSPAAGH